MVPQTKRVSVKNQKEHLMCSIALNDCQNFNSQGEKYNPEEVQSRDILFETPGKVPNAANLDFFRGSRWEFSK